MPIAKVGLEKHAGGRPVKFESEEALQKKIDEYFDWAEENKKPLTIARLACFLDCDRGTLLQYGRKDQFYRTVKRARDRILAWKEERINSESAVTGTIFDLKNNHGYVDTPLNQINMNQLNVTANVDVKKLTAEEKEELLREKLQ